MGGDERGQASQELRGIGIAIVRVFGEAVTAAMLHTVGLRRRLH